jgi:hypothetical protein
MMAVFAQFSLFFFWILEFAGMAWHGMAPPGLN